ncbi:DNA lyase [Neorhizobium galegae]|uniref:8-oxoguanine DNA glycosylase n=1 Tax=Neorhizobium galegae TaxID=399 RepID=UPI002107A858|nr:DNA lyase [Neorhizobium galegae]MCQ1764710.1 DNA lyase [Neorhizobium galegae]MCQ1849281.1 DNA lyase [Neorhizobium galegae]
MIDKSRLESAILSIYPDIQQRVTSVVGDADEQLLWKELSCCILSSQVKYSLAVSAAEHLEREGLFTSRRAVCVDWLESALRDPLTVEQKVVRYRFPRSKARQLGDTHDTVCAHAGGLSALLESFSCGEEARRWLVANVAGLGPKQASMFLRNTGMTYDLAVLDRHVIDYMAAIGLIGAGRAELSTLSGYAKREKILKSYAQGLGMAVGLLDWAIWIVMRVFKNSCGKVAFS